MAQRRLSADGRAELEAKREQLQLAPADARPRLSARWRHWVE